MIYDEMNKLLKNELSAIETYHQALEKEDTDPEHITAINELSAILDDHQRAASRIEVAIRQKGGEPVHTSGAWGTWSKIVMGTAQLFGDTVALKALKEGEESGLKDYEGVLRDTDIPEDAKALVSDLVATQRMHVQRLDSLMSRISTSP
jgi:rubrerythrin